MQTTQLISEVLERVANIHSRISTLRKESPIPELDVVHTELNELHEDLVKQLNQEPDKSAVEAARSHFGDDNLTINEANFLHQKYGDRKIDERFIIPMVKNYRKIGLPSPDMVLKGQQNQ